MWSWFLDLVGVGPADAERKRQDREFFELGVDEWFKRRRDARANGLESGPILLPEGIRIECLCDHKSIKPDATKAAANDNKYPPNGLISSGAT